MSSGMDVYFIYIDTQNKLLHATHEDCVSTIENLYTVKFLFLSIIII